MTLYIQHCHHADPPLPPQPTLEVLSEGTVLSLSWERPYSPNSFPVISYNLTIHNQTSHSSDSILLQDDMLTYNLTSHNICNSFNFTVTANNRVGTSREGYVTGGFPMSESHSYSLTSSYYLWVAIISL